jgi:formylmethanofuran dehydrogenase subunit E
MEIDAYLQRSSAQHSHLCPRQVLGVRMGLAALKALGMACPPPQRRLLVISETDGCFCDGLSAVTGCTVGHRTLRIEDYGKVAATFVEVESEVAIRLVPQPDIRQKAHHYAPEEKKPYFAQLVGYGRMPDEALFTFQSVSLQPGVKALLSRPGWRVNCARCGEEILNEREIVIGGEILCKACAGLAYYVISAPFPIDTLSLSASLSDRGELVTTHRKR